MEFDKSQNDSCELSNELADDVSQLLVSNLDDDAFLKMIDGNISLLLNQLDDLSVLQVLINEDNSFCFDQTLAQIKQKTEHFDQIFQKIDQLEKFVGIVKQQHDQMEKCVDQAEKDLDIGVRSSLKTMFNFLPKRQTQAVVPIPTYTPPEIINTSSFIHKS